jgi:predicted ATPase/DNA-binding SARP family transcriptional activator
VAVALTLLRDVQWRGTTVAGDRPRALLAALAAEGARAVPDERLIELVWGEDAVPANATKSLQVLVSRTRAACGADAIVRAPAGYRLGLAPAEVDCSRLGTLVRDAAAALDGEAHRAAALAQEALALADGLAPAENGGGPLTALRRAAAADVGAARVVVARAASRLGRHSEALPALEAAHAEHPQDESLLADLLRSEAAVRGPALALERFERHRRDLRERLGATPGERLQRVHRELLALDRPVRRGVRYDATSLVGRDGDVERLRALLSGARVVSIVGAGGLGKTRLAHVLARTAIEPVVHVVELVGVTAPDDLVGEVGSALGVRDSVSGRGVLTPEQRADVRARIAQRLGQVPGLLVLDNCEHLVDAVAELVAFLVSTTADLRVLTTSRAPLAIAAERVYPLGELATGDAARLFRERAVAARPGVALDDAVVRRIVTRLDGLPLAIELAAAKARAMAVEDIDRRLEDRFALLRGGDRSAPDRHRTLLAVIDWSWNLLDGEAKRALRRLALFPDGFTLQAADAVLGDGALDAVQALLDQSLLSVSETAGGVRYRMLETVREYGRMQLATAGDAAEATAARRRWATGYARGNAPRLAGADQLTAIAAIDAEEVNLAEELRETLADGDRAALVELLAPLAMFWTIRGAHGRLLVLTGAIGEALAGWRPPPELEAVTRAALAIPLTNARMTAQERAEPLRRLLARLGPGEEPALGGVIRVLLESDDAGGLERLAADPDPYVARTAHHWLAHYRENAGDVAGALEAAERALALVGEGDGPWLAAILHTQLAELTAHRGDRARAVAHGRAALPAIERLGAKDDEMQLRSLLALCAIADGRLDDAGQELERIDRVGDGEVLGGSAVRRVGHAELALARGDRAAGLAAYRESAAAMRELAVPGIPATGWEPWVLFGEATALAAHAHHGGGADEAHGRALFDSCRERVARALAAADPQLDFPVTGAVLFALGTWGLLRAAMPAGDAVALLVLAERFAYNRAVPTMAWERIAPAAGARRIGAARARLGDRPPRELLAEARAAVHRCRL